jgi:hypothetical protein
MLSKRRPDPGESPDDELVGDCRACGAGVVCLRSQARPPAARFSAFDRPRGAWGDLWTFECPGCGAVVYLRRKPLAGEAS